MRYLTTEEIEKALKKIYEVEAYMIKTIAQMQQSIETHKEETTASINSLRDEFSKFFAQYEGLQIKRKNAMLELAKKADEGG